MFTTVFTPILTLLAAAAICVHADPNPSSPGPGDVFIQGTPCTINWEPDSTGVWKDMTIDLMTGDNFNMIFLATVATHVDGTNPSKNTLSYTCLQVSPFAPIYFYQFSSPSSANKAWTGRFTITDSANDIVAPSQSAQPDGEQIPWGTGALVNGSSAGAAIASGVSAANSNMTTSPVPSTTSGLFTSYSQTSTQTVDSATPDAPATSRTASATQANGAVTALFGSISNIFLQTGLALGLGTLGFAVLF